MPRYCSEGIVGARRSSAARRRVGRRPSPVATRRSGRIARPAGDVEAQRVEHAGQAGRCGRPDHAVERRSGAGRRPPRRPLIGLVTLSNEASVVGTMTSGGTDVIEMPSSAVPAAADVDARSSSARRSSARRSSSARRWSSSRRSSSPRRSSSAPRSGSWSWPRWAAPSRPPGPSAGPTAWTPSSRRAERPRRSRGTTPAARSTAGPPTSSPATNHRRPPYRHVAARPWHPRGRQAASGPSKRARP